MLASTSQSQAQKSTHPSNTLVDVGGGVRETLSLTGLSANETVKVRADLVGLTGTKSVTLSASGLGYIEKKKGTYVSRAGIGRLKRDLDIP